MTSASLHAAGASRTREGQDEQLQNKRVRLIREAVEGDQAAFATLYRQSVSTVSRYVGAILHDQARTEDAVAQTFVAAWQQLPRLREPERFDAWLLRIAHNRAIDELRRRTAQPLETAEWVAAPAEQGPERASETRESLRLVRAALLALLDEQREAVVLRHVAGLRQEEIARQMGRSVEASRALLHRGLRTLRAAAPDAR